MKQFNKALLIALLAFISVFAISAQSKVPETFWMAPIILTAEYGGYSKSLTPDLLFRQAKFKTTEQMDGSKITGKLNDYSLKGNIVTFNLYILKNRDIQSRIVIAIQYSMAGKQNAVFSVSVKNMDSGKTSEAKFDGTTESVGVTTGMLLELVSMLLRLA